MFACMNKLVHIVINMGFFNCLSYNSLSYFLYVNIWYIYLLTNIFNVFS